MTPSDPIWGRAFMGDTLAFHILFALFGVGIPLLISAAELIGIIRRDSDFIAMAKRWTFSMATLFVAGAISGTVVAVAMATLWPKFTAFVGQVIALPFSLETYAFFLEAIFLGIYAYTWDSYKSRWTHWLTSLPIVIGSAASAFFITTVNAFMNAPQGFTYINGVITNVNQLAAMLNAATPTETVHSILSYYAASALFFAGLAAIMLLRHRKRVATKTMEAQERYLTKALVFTLVVGLFFSIAVGISGDSSARYLAYNEPEKLAAAEGVFVTGSNMPLEIGGIVQNNAIQHALVIPNLLSILVGGSADTIVKGLESFDPSTWPPLFIHYFFDGMVGIGIVMVLAPILFLALYMWRRKVALSRSMLWLVFVTGVLSLAAVELGWMFAEIGRQPYIIRGVMLVKDAYTTAAGVPMWALIFPVIYLILAYFTIRVLAKHYKNNPLL